MVKIGHSSVTDHSLAAAPPAPADVLRPGATLGVMGGGQLGAMFAMAGKRMGYWGLQ
ncbi:MAG: hypothetical protein NTY25_05040 [Planctomycetia bacterium]|nr:hypothetical protein [Planctomycetia bacterium]